MTIKQDKRKNTWLLLRGLGRESGHWLDFPKNMQAAFPNDNVMTLDLPGVGLQANATCPLTICKMTMALRKQVKEEVSEGSLSVFALSLGGMITMEWMRLYPNDFHRVILVNSSLKTFSPWHQRLRWQIYRPFFKALLEINPRLREKRILKLISNKVDIHDEVSRAYASIARQRPISRATLVKQLLAAATYKGFKTLPQDIKVAVFVSMGDHFVDPSCSIELSEHFGWPLFQHPWAGHDLCLDDTDWVLDTMSQWLGQ